MEFDTQHLSIAHLHKIYDWLMFCILADTFGSYTVFPEKSRTLMI